MKTLTFLSPLFLALTVSAADGAPPKEFSVMKRAAKKNLPPFRYTALFGEPHGKAFDDASYTDYNDFRILEVTLEGCDPGAHLSYISTKYGKFPPVYNFVNHPQPPTEPARTSTYGDHGKGQVKLTLKEHEFIKQVELTTYRAKTGYFKKSRRTRIGYIKITTDQSQTVSCGSKNAFDPPMTWKVDGYAFLHFSGSTGDAIDALSATFVPEQNY